jgi:hypothetical protein
MRLYIIYVLFLKIYFKNHVKISELTLVSLRGKFKLTEKMYISVSFYYIFQHSNVLVISRFQWLIWVEA